MTWEGMKQALAAFSSKFRTEVQAIDELDRDNPVIDNTIKLTGGKLKLTPVILKNANGVETIAIDASGNPIYEKTLECEGVKDVAIAKEVASIENKVIESHAKTQNYHVVSGLVLGMWGA
jgi:hypothetical protein